MREVAELYGRTLVIVAHADDEAVACGVQLQRMREPVVVICTDGAPQEEFFWRDYGTREAYAQLREREAREAAAIAGVKHLFLLGRIERDVFVDQQLHRQIPRVLDYLFEIAREHRPNAIFTLAYEGGHPDHDTCSFLGAQLGATLNLPLWEAPLYHRATSEMQMQRFIAENGSEQRLEISPTELERKRRMFAAYGSQRAVLEQFTPEIEIVRPAAAYDFARPPHEGVLNYEAWGWAVRGWELCDHFRQYMNMEHDQARIAA